jgi:hypothetical protein
MGSIVSENPGISIELKRDHDLPACALDNDVLVEVGGWVVGKGGMCAEGGWVGARGADACASS